MVLPHRLRLVDAAVQIRCVVLREANDGLKKDGEVEDEPEDGMRGGKVLVARAGLVYLDDDEAGQERGQANEVEEEVEGCAGALLSGSVRGLEDERGLRDEQQSGRVEQLYTLD